MKRTSLVVSSCLPGALAALTMTLGASIVLAACTHPSAGEAPQVTSEEASRGVVIATIATHDSKISILGTQRETQASTGSGEQAREDLRVVIQRFDDPHGTLVADSVGLDALRAKDPMVYAIVTSAIASRDGKATERGTYIDARLDPKPSPLR